MQEHFPAGAAMALHGETKGIEPSIATRTKRLLRKAGPLR
jgi:hypothetical protein